MDYLVYLDLWHYTNILIIIILFLAIPTADVLISFCTRELFIINSLLLFYKNVNKMCECHKQVTQPEMFLKTPVSPQQLFFNFTFNFSYEPWLVIRACLSALGQQLSVDIEYMLQFYFRVNTLRRCWLSYARNLCDN